MTSDGRLEFGVDDEPVDPTLCVARVRYMDVHGVLCQDICAHPRREHDTKGAGCRVCPCDGFVSRAPRPVIPTPDLRAIDEDIMAAALDAARRVAWCCAANVMGIPYRERREAMAQLRGALHALDGIDYQPSKVLPLFVPEDQGGRSR